jgi:MFS family permease
MDFRGLAGNVPKMALLRALGWSHLISAVLVPFFTDWGGLSYATMLLLESWFMLACFLLEVPTGTIADRFGRKVSVGLGCFMLAAASLLFGSVPRLPVFVLGETLFAAAITLLSGADEALVYDSLKALGREREATRVMARLEASKLGGILGGAVLGSLAAAAFGLRAPILLQAIPMALSGVVALTLVEPPRGERTGAARHSFVELFSGGLQHFRRAPALRSLALDQVAGAAIAWPILWMYQPQLLRSGVPLALFGLVHATMSLGQILLLSRLAVAERLAGGRVRLLRLTALVPPLALLVLSATSNGVASVGLVVLAVASGMGRPALFSGSLNARIPSEARATVLSAVSAARTLTVACLYPMIGLLLDRSLPLAFVALGSLGLLAAALAAAPAPLFDETPGQSETAA